MVRSMLKRLMDSRTAISNLCNRKDLYYVVEDAPWAIRQVGDSITSHLGGMSWKITTGASGIFGSLVHFGSINTFMVGTGMVRTHPSNRNIVTWFHVNPNDNRPSLTLQADKHVDLWHTASSTTHRKLINLGIPPHKVKVIPLGVDLSSFRPAAPGERKALRARLGIPEDVVVIGSFQKDGNGWGEGDEPKLIKGPDILCDVLDRLNDKLKLYVLLTGPARGYVKKRLEKAGIPYIHRKFENPEDVAEYYRAIDIYVMASREEGGPKQILEAMASGIPVVATAVGMAPDLIVNEVNGYLTLVEKTEDIENFCLRLASNSSLYNSFAAKGIETARSYDWKIISARYRAELYDPLFEGRRRK